MNLKGGKQLRARLKALRVSFKPIGRAWGETTAGLARSHTPAGTGKTRSSYRVRNATQRKATVVGSHVAYFIDKGPVRHAIRPKRGSRLVFQAGGRTVFARRVNHPGYRGRPFRARVAREALRRSKPLEQLVREWNAAA